MDLINFNTKDIIKLILIAILIFYITDKQTYEHYSPIDGNDSRGWPFRYYEYFGGECPTNTDCVRGNGFMPIYLFIDISIILSISTVITFIKKKYFDKLNRM